MRKILSVARLEMTKSRSALDRRVVIFMAVVMLVTALSAPYIGISTFSMTGGLYLVKSGEAPLDAVLGLDDRFKAVESPPYDIEINGSQVLGQRTERSRSALSAAFETVRKYRDERLKLLYPEDDPEHYYAFPVWVDIIYLDSSLTFVSEDIEVAPIEVMENVTETEKKLTATDAPDTTANDTGPVDGSPPGDIRPPFPLTSVMVSFMFVAPMFFISQLYSSSIMDERISRKGVMLLVSPIRGYEIVAGKTLPYFIALLVFTTIGAVLLGGDAKVVLLMVPVILIFLSTAFASSILARNFRELTMMLVFFAVVLGSYLFIPTAFINLHEYSIISPLTQVVSLLEGDAVPLDGMVFASVPLLFASLFTYLMCTLLVNEEGLMAKVEAFDKILDSVGHLLNYLGDWRIGVLTVGMLMVPIVFVIQLFLLVVFFNMMNISPFVVIAVTMAVSVMVEEWAKVLAPLVLQREGNSAPLWLGILSGMGYFLGEKGLLLIALSSVVEGGLGVVLFMGSGYLLMVPLFIHVTGAVVSSRAVAYGISPAKAVLLASALHFVFNLFIIEWGGMLG